MIFAMLIGVRVGEDFDDLRPRVQMERVYIADHGGTPILHVDYSGLEDPEELRGIARRATARVRMHAAGTLLVMVDLSGVPHNLVIAAIMQEGIAESRPHVHARAVVGLSPAATRSFEVATGLFGRPMARFDDAAAATEWLLAQVADPPHPTVSS